MSELIDEFGPAGYGVWWIILEKIAAHMDKSGRCFARYSIKKWSKSCGISAKKFQKVVGFLSKLGKLSAKKCDKKSDFLIIECPNLLKFRDEYSRKSGQTPDKRRTKSTPTPDQETDEQKQKQIQKTETDNPPNPPQDFSSPDAFLPEEGAGGCSDEDTSVSDSFLDCKNVLGMSEQETISVWNKCGDGPRFVEAVNFAIERNEKQTLDSATGFIIWAFENGKTSRKTREGKINGENKLRPERQALYDEHEAKCRAEDAYFAKYGCLPMDEDEERAEIPF
ncbi:MAG: hypothetical protein RTU92_02620 [Candidatus Thorarchaeota archaeon]